MARSHRIYVVMYEAIPVAAFTVKHELLTYLDRLTDLDALQIYVLPDGGGDNRKVWGATTYLAKKGKE